MSRLLQSGQHPDADQISAFVDHALPAHEREGMLAHLAECADCRETVALSLPAIESAPAPIAMKRPKRWSWSIRILLPVAATAVALVMLSVHYATNSHKSIEEQGRKIASEQPANPAKGGNAAAISGGGGGGSSSLTGSENQVSPNVPKAQPARPPKEKTEKLQQSLATDQVAADTMRAVEELRLPNGVTAISTATRGHQILAIDNRHDVFLSNDGGASWISVQVPWKGSAVKAELVSYPIPAAQGKPTAAGAIPRTSANVAAKREESIPSDAAQFAKQKSLRQELKGAYQAPANGTGAAIVAPSPAPLSSLTAPAPGQETLTGIITDRTGAVIPDASVAITNSADHASRTTVTGADGRYRIDGLAPGTYQFEAQARGFRVTTLSGVQIAASSPNTTDVALDVGAAAETVTVQAAAPEIETTSPQLSRNLIHPKQKSASPATLAEVMRIFVITTDNGDHWTSADGVNWRHE